MPQLSDPKNPMASVPSSAIKGMVRSILTMLKWAAILLGMIVATLLLIPFGMILLGYRVNIDSGAVAELAAKKGNVELCRSIINYGFFGPTSGESRAHCIYRYAKLTSDPSTCELLMPSEYGWSCLGTVKSELWKGIGCGSTKENINCGAYGIFSPNLGIDDCHVYDKQILRDWCHEERSATLQNIYECADISPDPSDLREICERRYAFKMKDPSLCIIMSSDERRTLCEMEINTWQQYSQNWSFAQ